MLIRVLSIMHSRRRQNVLEVDTTPADPGPAPKGERGQGSWGLTLNFSAEILV